MAEMKLFTSSVALLGDLVRSRSHERSALHATLMTAITDLDTATTALEPLHPTVGDEIQGIFATPGAALRTSHLLRLTLRTHEADIRFGIGLGDVRALTPDATLQDGPAWWAARAALETIEEQARSSGYAGLRTAFFLPQADGTSTPIDPLLHATLHLIDTRISALKPATCATLVGLVKEETNAATAARLKISASANSQRIIGNDLKPLADLMKASWELNSDAVGLPLTATTTATTTDNPPTN